MKKKPSNVISLDSRRPKITAVPSRPEGEALDFNDREAVKRYFADLETIAEDIASIAEDAVAPPEKRLLGPAEHARSIYAFTDALRSLLEYAGRALHDPKGPEDSPPKKPSKRPRSTK